MINKYSLGHVVREGGASETFVLNPRLTWLMARDLSAFVHTEGFKSVPVFLILTDVTS
jgi:hypothetical protein